MPKKFTTKESGAEKYQCQNRPESKSPHKNGCTKNICSQLMLCYWYLHMHYELKKSSLTYNKSITYKLKSSSKDSATNSINFCSNSSPSSSSAYFSKSKFSNLIFPCLNLAKIFSFFSSSLLPQVQTNRSYVAYVEKLAFISVTDITFDNEYYILCFPVINYCRCYAFNFFHRLSPSLCFLFTCYQLIESLYFTFVRVESA